MDSRSYHCPRAISSNPQQRSMAWKMLSEAIQQHKKCVGYAGSMRCEGSLLSVTKNAYNMWLLINCLRHYRMIERMNGAGIQSLARRQRNAQHKITNHIQCWVEATLLPLGVVVQLMPSVPSEPSTGTSWRCMADECCGIPGLTERLRGSYAKEGYSSVSHFLALLPFTLSIFDCLRRSTKRAG